MNPEDRHRRASALFLELCDLGPTERAERLAAACGGDAALRAEVEAMVRADSANEDSAFLEQPALEHPAAPSWLVGAGPSSSASPSSPAARPGRLSTTSKRWIALAALALGWLAWREWQSHGQDVLARNMAVRLVELNRVDTSTLRDALPSLEQSLASLHDRPALRMPLHRGLALLCMRAGIVEKGAAQCSAALKCLESQDAHDAHVEITLELAREMQKAEEWRRAENVFRSGLRTCVKEYGPGEPRTLAAVEELSGLLRTRGASEEADALLAAVRDLQRRGATEPRRGETAGDAAEEP